MHTGDHRLLASELLVNPPSSGPLAFSLRLASFLPVSDSPAPGMHTCRVTSALAPVTEIPRTVPGTPSIHHDEETITFYDSSANLIMHLAFPQGYHRRQKNRRAQAGRSKTTGRSLISKIDMLVRHSIDPIYGIT